MSDLSEKSRYVEETEICPPGCGCNCGTSSNSKKLKLAVCLIVLLAVAGIFIYKASGTKQKSSSDSAKEANFAVAQSTPKSITVNNSDASGIKMDKKVEKIAPVITNATAPESTQTNRKIGEYLASLNSLNKAASGYDTVFVFIPAPKSELADDATSRAVIAAQLALKSKNINLGLYTLPNSSPDYAAISAQVQTPAILVATKGKGMVPVSGEVTETKLLQAYIASAQSGGCCCGSSGCN